jgi:DNA-binding response OmpR family regulator
MSSPSRILYVDDDKDSSELARVLLSHSDVDCQIISAESAREGLLLILKENFDLYIFDYKMPEITGIELCRCVRQFDSNTPVLFYSAMARPVDIAKAIEAGANEYLIKPNDLDNLTMTVKRLLNESLLIRSQQSIINTRVDIPIEASSEQVSQPAKIQPLIWKDVFEKSIVSYSKTQFRRLNVINNQTSRKKYNQNQIQTDNVNKSGIRPLLISGAIFTVCVIHFISQITFFQRENILTKEDFPRTENQQSVKTETRNQQSLKTEKQYEAINDAKTLDIETKIGKVASDVAPKTKIVPSRIGMKKQERRESRAERLRRAERILTGV